jgi:hypothetical protein
MTLPDVDALDTVGGALLNAAPVVNVDTDRDAAGANQAYADSTAATHTITRAWVQMTVNGSATPTLVAHDSVWGNAISVAPTLAYSGSTGIFTCTWPTVVQDEIPNGAPGYSAAGHTLNLRDGWANLHVVATAYDLFVNITAPNVATIYCFNTSGALANPGTTTGIGLFVI